MLGIVIIDVLALVLVYKSILKFYEESEAVKNILSTLYGIKM